MTIVIEGAPKPISSVCIKLWSHITARPYFYCLVGSGVVYFCARVTGF